MLITNGTVVMTLCRAIRVESQSQLLGNHKASTCDEVLLGDETSAPPVPSSIHKLCHVDAQPDTAHSPQLSNDTSPIRP